MDQIWIPGATLINALNNTVIGEKNSCCAVAEVGPNREKHIPWTVVNFEITCDGPPPMLSKAPLMSTEVRSA